MLASEDIHRVSICSLGRDLHQMSFVLLSIVDEEQLKIEIISKFVP